MTDIHTIARQLTPDELETLRHVTWPIEADRDPGRVALHRDMTSAVQQIKADAYYAGHRSACAFTENLCREVHTDLGSRP